jgi:hypothetical protein
MLAAAYRSILPEDRLCFAERDSDRVIRCPDAVQPASQESTDSKLHFILAIGGH